MQKILLFFLLVSLSYCSKEQAVITNETLAAVNARTITKDDFISQAQTIANTPSVNLTTKDGRITVLKDMINEEMVFQQALKEQFHLKNLNVKHEIVKEFLKQKFAKELPPVSDEQVKNYYDTHKPELDQVRVSHVLFATKKDDPKSKKTAYEKAQKVRADIVAGKITFADAATKYSADQGSQRSEGDIGYFPQGKMVETFSNASFALKKIGELSPIVESEYGYHIIKLTGEMRGFDAYKEKIRWKLYQDVMQPKIDAYFQTLLEKSKVRIINAADLEQLSLH